MFLSLPLPLDGTIQLQENKLQRFHDSALGELWFIIYHNVIQEIKCTINVMYLNHPKTTPTLTLRKLSSTVQVLGPKSVGDLAPWVP